MKNWAVILSIHDTFNLDNINNDKFSHLNKRVNCYHKPIAISQFYARKK
jgi:hypothetical protein